MKKLIMILLLSIILLFSDVYADVIRFDNYTKEWSGHSIGPKVDISYTKMASLFFIISSICFILLLLIILIRNILRKSLKNKTRLNMNLKVMCILLAIISIFCAYMHSYNICLDLTAPRPSGMRRSRDVPTDLANKTTYWYLNPTMYAFGLLTILIVSDYDIYKKNKKEEINNNNGIKEKNKSENEQNN